ncbi:MAG: hypothetical protein KKC76_12935 [Proteobacteria bacterium]|nr:hypothetical protein [Pseudomonadota bacterium]MBU4294981.1 hypothetical protein [Pseudomonadota bacterium]MCG2746667.1 hypothetical protein [Desulfobulbaceae bacterium]
MSVHTPNSAGFSATNLYKMNLTSNKDLAQDMSQTQEKTAENGDYQVRISEEAQQLAQQAKIRTGSEMAPPTVQETEPALNRSRFEITTQNMAVAAQLAVQNSAAVRNGIEVVA